MNTAAEILGALRTAGAQGGSDGGRLRVRAAAGRVPPALRASAEAERDGILALLAAEASEADRLEKHGREGGGVAGLDALVERVLALSREERMAWRREVIHAAVWAAAGKRDDPHLLADLRVLRRVEAAGVCLRCGETCPPDGRFWCDECDVRYARSTEDDSR